MIAKFGMYLQFPFVRYALIVSVLVALCSALLGVTLVLRRFSLSETASPMWLSAPCQWRRS